MVQIFRSKSYWLLIAIIVGALISWTGKNPVLKNGMWRAVIERADGNGIVFNFQTKDSAGKKILYLINAEERLLADSITYKGDSIIIQLPFFDSEFRVKVNAQGNVKGQWVKKFGDRIQVLPLQATFNAKERFDVRAKPTHNASGRWAVKFTGKNNNVTEAIGEFEQNGSKLSGTFLTATGDYRYLEGAMSGDSLVLSGFDGGNAYLFTARLNNDSTISNGNFYSGPSSVETWVGKKNANVELPDGYQLTTLREGESKLNFKFPDLNRREVSINDHRFKNKVVVVQILGSWCPNCMDETNFLSEYYNKNKEKGVEVIGLAYERTEDFERSKTALQRFEKRFDVQYPLLITGVTVSDPRRTEKTLPQLTDIKAFPTSIYIDKKGTVRKIYSGFTGPGTGEHYTKFKKEFEETINGLLNE